MTFEGIESIIQSVKLLNIIVIYFSQDMKLEVSFRLGDHIYVS